MPGPQMSLIGSQQFGNLSKALKAAGGDLRKEYLKALRTATAPAKTTIPESARTTLPRRGGLNETVARNLKVTTRTSLSGPTATVRIVATEGPRKHITDLNRGRLRHPVFGNREVWVGQPVLPGFFTRPCLALRPGARRQIAEATNEVLRKIAAS